MKTPIIMTIESAEKHIGILYDALRMQAQRIGDLEQAFCNLNERYEALQERVQRLEDRLCST